MQDRLDRFRAKTYPVTCLVGQDKWARATEIERALLKENVGLYKIALLDTGASCHVWRHASDLGDIDWKDNPPIKGIGGVAHAEATGTLGKFGRAMLCPEVLVNIISVSSVMANGCRAEFTNLGAKLYGPDGAVFLTAHYRFGLWFCVFVADR